MAEQIKILFLAANPKDSKHLRLEDEAKYIDEAVQRSNSKKEYRFYNKGAVTIQDLRRAMTDIKPNVVHFSGHGSEVDTLLFEDSEGYSKEISSDALGEFFSLFTEHLSCVILNACYSLKQAQGIIDNVPLVIGMNSEIPNRSAKIFSQSFYESYCRDKPIEEAFRIAKNTLRLENPEDAEIPIIHINNPEIVTVEDPNPINIKDENYQDELVTEEQLNYVMRRLNGDIKIYTGYATAIIASSSAVTYAMYDKNTDSYILIASLLLSLIAAIPLRELRRKRNGKTFIHLLKEERLRIVKQLQRINQKEIDNFNLKFHHYIQEKFVK